MMAASLQPSQSLARPLAPKGLGAPRRGVGRRVSAPFARARVCPLDAVCTARSLPPVTLGEGCRRRYAYEAAVALYTHVGSLLALRDLDALRTFLAHSVTGAVVDDEAMRAPLVSLEDLATQPLARNPDALKVGAKRGKRCLGAVLKVPYRY